MQDFTIFRALGLSFKAWFRNLVPFTLLAAVLFSPIIVWAVTLPGGDSATSGDLERLSNQYQVFFDRGVYALMGLSALLAPLLTYRVVQDMSGTRVSLLTSMKLGLRGILPAIFLAAMTSLLQLIPAGGGIASTILTCYCFVATPAAVAERLGPFKAFSRSAELTRNRRWGIFGLNLVIGLVIVAIIAVWVYPLFTSSETDPAVIAATLKRTAILLAVTVCVFQLFIGIVQAVSYSLLRTDKEGISNEELAKVFE